MHIAGIICILTTFERLPRRMPRNGRRLRLLSAENSHTHARSHNNRFIGSQRFGDTRGHPHRDGRVVPTSRAQNGCKMQKICRSNTTIEFKSGAIVLDVCICPNKSRALVSKKKRNVYWTQLLSQQSWPQMGFGGIK